MRSRDSTGVVVAEEVLRQLHHRPSARDHDHDHDHDPGHAGTEVTPLATPPPPSRVPALLVALRKANAVAATTRAAKQHQLMRAVNRRVRGQQPHGAVFLVDPFMQPGGGGGSTTTQQQQQQQKKKPSAQSRWRRAIGKVQSMQRWRRQVTRGTPATASASPSARHRGGDGGSGGRGGRGCGATRTMPSAVEASRASQLTTVALDMLARTVEGVVQRHTRTRTRTRTPRSAGQAGDSLPAGADDALGAGASGDAAAASANVDALVGLFVEGPGVQVLSDLFLADAPSAAKAVSTLHNLIKVTTRHAGDSSTTHGGDAVQPVSPVLQHLAASGVVAKVAQALAMHGSSGRFVEAAFGLLSASVAAPGQSVASLGLGVDALRAIQAAWKQHGAAGGGASGGGGEGGSGGAGGGGGGGGEGEGVAGGPGGSIASQGRFLIDALSDVYAEQSGALFARLLRETVRGLNSVMTYVKGVWRACGCGVLNALVCTCRPLSSP